LTPRETSGDKCGTALVPVGGEQQQLGLLSVNSSAVDVDGHFSTLTDAPATS